MLSVYLNKIPAFLNGLAQNKLQIAPVLSGLTSLNN